MDDLRLNGESALVAPLSNRIALRLGWLVKHDTLPVTGKRDTDTLFTSGIQIAI